jgi:hypothetical protein
MSIRTDDFCRFFYVKKWTKYTFKFLIAIVGRISLILAEIQNTSLYSKLLNPLHERVSEHRDKKYFGEVSFWPAEYRNRPPIVPLIFNFKNFGEL